MKKKNYQYKSWKNINQNTTLWFLVCFECLPGGFVQRIALDSLAWQIVDSPSYKKTTNDKSQNKLWDYNTSYEALAKKRKRFVLRKRSSNANKPSLWICRLKTIHRVSTSNKQNSQDSIFYKKNPNFLQLIHKI